MLEKRILGIKVNFGMTMPDVLNNINSFILSNKFNYICTTNPEFVVDAQSDREFAEVINNSALSLPDGSGLLFAKRYLDDLKPGHSLLSSFVSGIYLGVRYIFGAVKLEEKITGVALVDTMCSLAEEKGYSVFFLGGWPKDYFGKPLEGTFNLALAASTKLLGKYPNLKIVGATSEFSPRAKDDHKTIAYIKTCMNKSDVGHIDMIFVAYGHNKQEKWLVRNGVQIPVRVGVGVGGTFDYISGIKKSPPAIIKKANMEWLYRLFTQPWRISRILKAFPKFPLLIWYRSAVKNKERLNS